MCAMTVIKTSHFKSLLRFDVFIEELADLRYLPILSYLTKKVPRL